MLSLGYILVVKHNSDYISGCYNLLFYKTPFSEVNCIVLLIPTHLNSTHSRHRNQHNDLLGKSVDWFLYDRDLRPERVKNVKASDN